MEWINVEKQLPTEDVYMILYIVRKDNEKWWKIVSGCYHGKFYADGGIDYSIEKVTHWQPINKPK